jgi:putative transposase
VANWGAGDSARSRASVSLLAASVAIAKAVKILKGTTARLLFLDFPAIHQKLWNGALWSPSYYVGTAGHVSAQTIQRYIERTEHIRGRR